MSSIVHNMACFSKTATGENTTSLGRFRFTTSKSSRIQYGKPCAVKVARTVWKQGKCREASTYAYYSIPCSISFISSHKWEISISRSTYIFLLRLLVIKASHALCRSVFVLSSAFSQKINFSPLVPSIKIPTMN